MASHGRLTPTQAELLRPFITGRQIHDMGSGPDVMASVLLSLGAKHVVMVDKVDFQLELHPQITFIHAKFDEFQGEMEVMFLGAPINQNLPELVELTRRSPLVIYAGTNTGGTTCGSPGLFLHFATREILLYEPDPRSTLIVYGRPCARPRPLKGEEIAALSEKLFYYHEVEKDYQ